MSASVPRATFAALRARREALHVASDILYEEPIDVRTVACSGCGAWIDVRARTITNPLTCPACGAKTPLPAYFRGKYMTRQPPLVNWLDPEPEIVWEPPPSVPRWLIWFSVILVTLLLAVVAGLVSR